MFSLHVDTARTWRGGQNQVLVTVLGLRALGHRTVLVAHPTGELRRRAQEGLDLIPLAPRAEMDLAAAWRLSRVLKQLKPDIVHAHDPHGVAMASIALSMSTLPAPPRLVASRRVDFHMRRSALSRWKYRQVDCFICASDAIRQIVVSDGIPRERAVTVHEGIDLGRVAAAPPAELHKELWLPHEAPLVGNVAALVPHKGQRHLVDAAALVLPKHPDARFIIAGEGELRAALEHQIRQHHLEKHVILAGFRTDILSLHKAFDLFVMSSVTEGLGTSILDAMACGKPVVGTTAGGIPEVVVDGETGLLVPPRDAEAMAAAIVRLLADRALRERMGAAGLARVRERFSAETMVHNTLDGVRAASSLTMRADRPKTETTRNQAITGGQEFRSSASGSAFRGNEPLRERAANARPAPRSIARAVVEGDGGAVVGERQAAGNPGARIGIAGTRSIRPAGAFVLGVVEPKLLTVDQEADPRAIARPGDLGAPLAAGRQGRHELGGCRGVGPAHSDSHHPLSHRVSLTAATAVRRGRGARLQEMAVGPAPARRRPQRDASARPAKRRQRQAAARRRRGWQCPLSGHWLSPCRRPNPQAFIMPT